MNATKFLVIAALFTATALIVGLSIVWTIEVELKKVRDRALAVEGARQFQEKERIRKNGGKLDYNSIEDD